MSPTSPAGIPATGTWKIDSVHSSATFRVAHHRVATFRGHFHDVRGELLDGVLSGSVESESLDVGTMAVFKEQLLGPEWFDLANHATLSFRSTDLHAHGDHLHGAGELTIRGVTRAVELSGNARGPIAVPSRDGRTADRLGLDLSTTINRREFGLTGDGGAADQVTIDVSLELVAQ